MNHETECQDVGDSLTKLKHAILLEWEKRVRGSIQEMKHENNIILHNHIIEILEQLARLLSTGEMDSEELGKAHGFQRAALTKSSLNDILQEYSLMRETLIDYLYPMGNIICAKIVHKYIDILCKYSMVEFITYLDSIQVKVETETGEAKEVDKTDLDILVASLKKII